MTSPVLTREQKPEFNSIAEKRLAPFISEYCDAVFDFYAILRIYSSSEFLRNSISFVR